MKHKSICRVLAMLLSLVTVLSVLSGMVVFATTGTLSHNTATRHQVCTALSSQAKAYYTGNYTYAKLSALSGVSSPTDSWATTQNNPLYTALQTLMTDTHTVYSRYNPSGEQSDELSYLWDYTDSVGNSSQYQYFYTDISADSYGTGDMQREHVWPKSNASYYETNGGADLHHLRPSIGGVNSAKSNHTFGNIASTGSAYQVNEVDVIWTGSSMLEVRDNIKGDVARILLYVYCRWGQPNLYTDVSASKLPTMDSDDSTNNGTRAIDGLDTLLQWMEIDPVDQWEMARNDQTENFQGNRNVFIDYPEFAWLIFNEDVPANYTTPSGNGGSGSGTTSYTITASVNNSSYGSATVSGNTIIATPKTGYEVSGYTLLSGTATVTQNGNVFTVEASSNCSIRINFKARTAYTVAFSVPDGVNQSSLSCYAGESITLPTPTGTPTADAQDYKFSGWVTSPVDNSSERPTILAAGSSYTPTASTTLYALYTYVTGSNGTIAYHLVTDASQLVSGASVIIAAADYDYALSTTQNTNNRAQAQVTKNTTDNTLAFAEDAGVAELTLREGNLSGTYAFYDSTALGYLYAASSSSNYLRTESTLSDNSSFTVAINSDGSCTLTAQGSYTKNILRYNASSKIFSCYGTTSTNMKATALYTASAGGETFYTTVLGEACNHSYSSVVTAPTCTEGGFTTHTCTLCGYIYVDSTTAALGHNYDSGTVTTAATCETPGVLTYACQNEGCNSSYTETIPSTGHNYVGGICANCGDIQGTANSYTLVTSGTPITGDAILVVKAGGSNSGSYTYYAMKRATDSTYLLAEGADEFMGTGTVPSSISVADDTLVWNMAVSASTLTLSDGGSNVLYHTDNNLYYTTGTAADWTFAFDSTTGTFKLSHSSRYLGLRDDLSSTGSNGNPRFRCNGSATTTSYQFYIYQAVAADHTHSTTAVAAKAPTCTEGGNLAYWYCAGCGKYFSDAACTVETTLAALTLEATGHSYVNGVCSVCGASNEIYELTTSLSDGDRVVIVNVSYNKALSSTYSGYYNAGVDVAPSNKQILDPAEEIIWTVGIDADGNYTFSTASGSKLSMDTGFTSTPLDKANDTWTLTAAPTTADAFYIGNVGRSGYYLEWYSSRNYWSAYNNTSSEALFAVQFYVKTTQEHTHSYTAVVTDPTCTAPGYTTYTCSCGDSYTANETAALGHSDQDGNNLCDLCGGEYIVGDWILSTTAPTAGNKYIIAAYDDETRAWYALTTKNVYAPTSAGSVVTFSNNTIVDPYDYVIFGAKERSYTLGSSTWTGVGFHEPENRYCLHLGNANISVTSSAANGIFSFTPGTTENTFIMKGDVNGRYLTFDNGKFGISAEAGTELYFFYKPCDHDITYINNAEEPTCTTVGSTGATKCSWCGKVLVHATEIPMLEHSYDAVVTEPTCTEAGYTTYTCSVCGDTYTADLTEAAGHDYTYTNNGENHTVGCNNCDYSATEGHTYENGSCPCGATETVEPTELELKFYHSMSFDADLKINYRFAFDEIEAVIPNYVLEGAYLEIEKDRYSSSGEKTVEKDTISYTVDEAANRLVFSVVGIQSVEMGSELRAVLHIFDSEGKEYVTQVDVYSVLTYVTNNLAKNDGKNNEFCTLLVDALNYGAAAQIFFDRRTDELVNAGIDAYQHYATQSLREELTASKETVTTQREITAVSKMNFSMSFDEMTKMNVKLTLTGDYTKSDITAVKVFRADGTLVETFTDFELLEDGRLQVTFTGVKSIMMRDMFYFEAYVGEQLASDRYGYSMEAYAKSNVDSSNTKLGDMVLKCMYYGDSAETYFQNK